MIAFWSWSNIQVDESCGNDPAYLDLNSGNDQGNSTMDKIPQTDTALSACDGYEVPVGSAPAILDYYWT